jgi:hypothetical protein
LDRPKLKSSPDEFFGTHSQQFITMAWRGYVPLIQNRAAKVQNKEAPTGYQGWGFDLWDDSYTRPGDYGFNEWEKIRLPHTQKLNWTTLRFKRGQSYLMIPPLIVGAGAVALALTSNLSSKQRRELAVEIFYYRACTSCICCRQKRTVVLVLG